MVWLCSRFCLQPWDGSQLILGTMYSYDIFAAVPCCAERLKVSHTSLTCGQCQFVFFISVAEAEPPLAEFR